MIRATIVKEVLEVMYVPEPENWVNYTEAQKKSYVLNEVDGSNIEHSEVLETRSVYSETLRLG